MTAWSHVHSTTAKCLIKIKDNFISRFIKYNIVILRVMDEAIKYIKFTNLA
jgi:hypothetical protein